MLQRAEKKIKIKDLLVMARPGRVTFGLLLASSSSELINARMTSLESSFPPESMASLLYLLTIATLICLTVFSSCPAAILCQSLGIAQCWLASFEGILPF